MLRDLQEKDTLHVPKNKSTLVIPSDGNCMYSMILAGYLALKGEYPVVEIQGIQYSINSYQDCEPQEAIYATIKDLIESNNFIGFLKAESFSERLISIRKQSLSLWNDLSPTEVEDIIDGQSLLDEPDIELYIDAITVEGTWGTDTEIIRMSYLLNVSIYDTLSLPSECQPEFIEYLYQNGNHYDVIINIDDFNPIGNEFLTYIGGYCLQEDLFEGEMTVPKCCDQKLLLCDFWMSRADLTLKVTQDDIDKFIKAQATGLEFIADQESGLIWRMSCLINQLKSKNS